MYAALSSIKTDNPAAARHFFFPVTISIPNRPPIHTKAFLDSGAQTSLVGEHFVSRHSLPRHVLDTPLALQTFDGQPAAAGLVTQGVLTHLSITSSDDLKSSHREFKSFGIAQMPFEIMLGSDWLRHHNPQVDWIKESLHFTCCNSNSKVARDASITDEMPQDLDPDHPDHSSPPSADHRTEMDASTPRKSSTSPSLPDIKAIDTDEFFSIDDVVAFGALRVIPDTPPVLPPSIPASFAASSIAPASDDDIQHILDQLPAKYHEFADIFRDKEVETLAPHRPLHDIKIDIEDGKAPPFGTIYSLSSEERVVLHDYIQDMLRRGFIRHSSSEAASPVLFVKKANGSLRLCVDYRGLNNITKRNSYPLPLVNDLLNVIRGSTIFSKLDLKSAFNLLRVAPGDEWKTAFRTNEGLFEYLVMPFGLTNAPAAWQSFMQWVLREQLDICCIVYLDDILIFSRTQAQHDIDVAWVLTQLKSYSLYCNVEKCEFDRTELEYLGFLLGINGVRMHPKKLDTIASWPIPNSVKSVQKWLGFTNFYRRFIENYAALATPLHILTRKDAPIPFKITPAALDAFNRMKTAFTSAPVLAHFNDAKESFLYTDASDFAISGILYQLGDDNERHPIAFFSRKLDTAEINYDIHDKEMLAVMASLRDFRHWLSGTLIPVSVITDHKNLQYFMSQRVLNRRQSRWMLELSEYNIRLSYAPGAQNPADAPSRRDDYVPLDGDPVKLANSAQLLSPTSLERLSGSAPSGLSIGASSVVHLASDSTSEISSLKDSLASDPTWDDAIKKGDKDFAFHNDIVTFRNKIYIPPPLRLKIIQTRHDSPLAGHLGAGKTIELVQREFSWPGLSREIRAYIRGCDSCQRVKVAHHAPYGKLTPLDIPSRPWQSVSMDFITGLPTSHGHDAILVVVDRLTKQSHFIPTVIELDAPALAQVYLTNIVRLHGVPESIVSDRGSVFISSFWQSLQSLMGSKLRFSTAYHPQSDGQTERVNAILENYLRHYCSYQQDDWVDYLPLAEFSYNNASHDATRISPFFANYGYHPHFSFNFSNPSTTPSASEFSERLAFIRDELSAELRHAQDVARRKYDAHRTPPPSFSIGDQVMLLRRNLRTTRPTEKLDFRKLGPFKILKKLSDNVYQLALPSTMSRLHPVFNIDLLEPYTSPASFPGRSAHSSAPTPIVDDGSAPGFQIQQILDVRRVGRRFDYFVEFKGLPTTERAWIPLSDIPSSYNEVLEVFHRRHPRLQRPADSTLLRNRPLIPSSTPHGPIQHPSSQPTSETQNTSIIDNAITTPIPTSLPPPPPHLPLSPLPPRLPPSLAVAYTPPSRTTTRSGRVSRPVDHQLLSDKITAKK